MADCTGSSMERSRITAALNLAEESQIPKLSAESTWNFEM
ncbi:hypothetical protein Pint_08931 [Pistacia integerrima]|uniref:Uncharacterized protein n=1 Tax=Pistacia integerrima TaxID=434235 RepID=A0ACC0XVS4_9ROSI|nr:hypothetical protein Pint_08931 [Pistacia integerrima]